MGKNETFKGLGKTSVSVSPLWWAKMEWIKYRSCKRTHHRGSCPERDTSAACSVDSGYGWSGRLGSSSVASTSTWHCSAGCAERNPANKSRREGRIWQNASTLSKDQLFLFLNQLLMNVAHLAAFTGDDTIVNPWWFVPTDFTGNDFYLSCRERQVQKNEKLWNPHSQVQIHQNKCDNNRNMIQFIQSTHKTQNIKRT